MNSLTSRERRVLAAIDTQALIDSTTALVRLPSYGGNEGEAQALSASLMRAAGLDVDAWEIDLTAVKEHPCASWEIERESALGVAGSLAGSGSGPTLVLNGHVDVVPAGDASAWTTPPFEPELRDGLLHGRGALDMKGQLMAGLAAVRAVVHSDTRLTGRVVLHSVIGEEDGGLGTLATLLRGHTGDGAIVLEPTGLTLAPAQAGCLNFRVRVRGRGAHGAVRNEGVSALEGLIHVHRALLDLESDRNAAGAGPLFARWPLPFPLSIGTFSGGSWASSVPDEASMEGRLGIRPDETAAGAKAEFEETVCQAAEAHDFLRDHRPVVEWWGGRYLPMSTDVDDPLITTLRDVTGQILGSAPEQRAVPFGADAGLFQHVAGMPAVLFGAGDIRRAHAPDECVSVDELVRMSQILAVMILRYCGVENG